ATPAKPLPSASCSFGMGQGQQTFGLAKGLLGLSNRHDFAIRLGGGVVPDEHHEPWETASAYAEYLLPLLLYRLNGHKSHLVPRLLVILHPTGLIDVDGHVDDVDYPHVVPSLFNGASRILQGPVRYQFSPEPLQRNTEVQR